MATAASKSNGIDKSVKDLEAQIAALKADVSDLSGTLQNIGRDGASDLNTKARETADKLRAKGAETAQYAGEQAKVAYGQAEDQVRNNPAAAVGIAAGVGFIAGLFLRGRK